jgi:hypothetical protein
MSRKKTAAFVLSTLFVCVLLADGYASLSTDLGIDSPEKLRAVYVGRGFLLGHGVGVGRVLGVTTETGDPNYYWHTVFGLDRPGSSPPTAYYVVRYQQAERPGHYYEVWVSVDSLAVVGGGQCR